MIGAIIGDFVGSRFEFSSLKFKDFTFIDDECSFTDDTVMTIAVAEALMLDKEDPDFAAMMRQWGRMAPDAGYGAAFRKWLQDSNAPAYGSWANGGAMRVSACAWFADDFRDAMRLARLSAEVSHNHPEGVRGAMAVAAAIFAGLSGWEVASIQQMLTEAFEYDLGRDVDTVRAEAEFDLRAKVSVPEAIICALEAVDFEDAIRNAVSLSGDSDTQAAIAGSIAETLFPVPADIRSDVISRLPKPIQDVMTRFSESVENRMRVPLTWEQVRQDVLWDRSWLDAWNTSEFDGRLVDDMTPAEATERWEKFEEDLRAGEKALSRVSGGFLGKLLSSFGRAHKK